MRRGQHLVEPAQARLGDEEGYRYQGIIEHEQLRLPTNLNNPAFEWVTDRTVGAFLAPGRLHEELIGGDASRSCFGYDARITVDGRSWLFYQRDGSWQEAPAVFEPSPANAINIILGDQALPFEVVEDVVRLRGEGGCVLRAEVSSVPVRPSRSAFAWSPWSVASSPGRSSRIAGPSRETPSASRC